MGYRGYGLPVSEIISEGNIGLMQALNRFEPEKGFRFSTYAIWWIRAAIQDCILRSWSLVKIGTTAKIGNLGVSSAAAVPWSRRWWGWAGHSGNLRRSNVAGEPRRDSRCSRRRPGHKRYGGNPSSKVRAACKSAVAKPSVNRS
jgi:RNA polymerase sigma factor (sigma-70 family)